jgi:RTA1 like protein
MLWQANTNTDEIFSTAEAIGWAGRTWSAKCPYNHDAFLMQITTLIIAPTFFAAGLYVILGQMIHLLGRNTSIISPRAYLMVFCSCDLVSLVLQAAGGGLASVASGKLNGNTKPGTNLMVAGIAFQLGTMSFFALLVLDFLRRSRKLAMQIEYKKVLFALFISFTMIYIRSVYRTVELAQGWTGYLITHEGYFIGLDAALMFVAVIIFLVFDPAVLLPNDTPVVEGSTSEIVTESENDKTRPK